MIFGFELAKRNYRVYFLVVLLNIFVPPLTLAALISILVISDRDRVFHAFTYTLAAPLYWTVLIQYDNYTRKREAARLGAVLAPEVKGKWPGNIDVLFRMNKVMKTSYASTEIEHLFNEVDEHCDTINFRLLWQDNILTRDHHVMQHVLATGFDEFEKGVNVKLKLFDLFGDGIFNTDGAEWKAHRALTRPFFVRERVTDYEHYDKYSNKVIDLLKKRVDNGESTDLQDIFARFTLDAAGEFLFGVSDLNTLDLPLTPPGKARMGAKGNAPATEEGSGTYNTRYSAFVNAFEALQVEIPPRGPRGNLWPLWELFRNVAAKSNKAIDDWVGPLVRQAIDAKVNGLSVSGKKAIDEGSLLDHIADNTDDVKLIRDELINILLAGRDTTAALLTFLFYSLCNHPEVLAKLRSEIVNAVPSGAPSYDDVREMRYLRACINETLRLFPPVPTNTRCSIRPTVVPTAERNPDGTMKRIYVPGKGTPLRYTVLLMQRRNDLWGPDALEFVPERWLDPERIKDMTSDPFKFLPFNAGPRICLGQNFAYNEISFLTVRILQSFDSFELRQKEDAPAEAQPPTEWKSTADRRSVEKIWPRAALTMFSLGGVWVRMKMAAA